MPSRTLREVLIVTDEAEISFGPITSRLGRATVIALMILALLAVVLLSDDNCPVDGLPCTVQAWPLAFYKPHIFF